MDAKNSIQVMLLAAGQGMEGGLVAEGPDEEAAIEALTELINDYFGEGE